MSLPDATPSLPLPGPEGWPQQPPVPDAERPRESRSPRRAIALATACVVVLLATTQMPFDMTGNPEYGRHYAFRYIQPGTTNTPIGFDPCLGLNIVVNDQDLPGDGTRLVTEAAAELSEVSGIPLRVVGTTRDRATFRVRTVMGQPVLVDWSNPTLEPGLSGRIAGRGGSMPVRGRSGRQTLAAGSIGLDTPSVKQRLNGIGGDRAVKGLIIHELGHVLGLGHPIEDGQLMSASGGPDVLRKGDLKGLQVLAAIPCGA